MSDSKVPKGATTIKIGKVKYYYFPKEVDAVEKYNKSKEAEFGKTFMGFK